MEALEERCLLSVAYSVADLGTLGGSDSYAAAINASGQVAGYSTTAGGATHAFLFSNGISDLGILGGTNSDATSINTSGQVAGYSDTSGAYHAFFYDGTTMTDLGTLGGPTSIANALNASDQVVGESTIAGGALHAFMYDGTAMTMTDLGTLGGTNSDALGINSSGQVVGYSYIPGNSVEHAFFYDGTTLRDLNGLIPSGSGWVLTKAESINDSDQIVGVGTFNGQNCAFLLTPLPSGDLPLAAPAGGRPPAAVTSVGSGPGLNELTSAPAPLAPAGIAAGMVPLPAPAPALSVVPPAAPGDGNQPTLPAPAAAESASNPLSLSRFDSLLSMGAGARSMALAKGMSARDAVFAALSSANEG